MQTDAAVELADATLEYVQFDRVLEQLPAERIKEGVLQKKILGRNGAGRWEDRCGDPWGCLVDHCALARCMYLTAYDSEMTGWRSFQRQCSS